MISWRRPWFRQMIRVAVGLFFLARGGAGRSVTSDNRHRKARRGFTGFTFCAQYCSMERQAQITGVGGIYAVLAEHSSRPRYAFLVLQLVAEIADGRGQAGPYVQSDGGAVLLRDWLCTQLLPMSEQPGRRNALRARVAAAIAADLTGDADADRVRIEAAVEEQVLAVGRANVSRAISDLVRAGLMSRHYAGYATDHVNRGGGRHAVYVVPGKVLRLLGRPVTGMRPVIKSSQSQGELFAA